MPRDHIIPKFILRGFAINPTAKKQNQKIMIYDRGTKQVKIEKIADAYAIRDFNSPETEKLLAQRYESDVAKIFKRISDHAEGNLGSVALSNAEYKLLFRFFVIMWRRNNIQMDKAKEMSIQLENIMKSIFGSHYNKMIKPEYKDYSFEKMFDEKIDDVRKAFYDKVISETTDDDSTVQKAIKYYPPFIVHNKSGIHFLLHNTYATLRYFVPQDQKEIYEYDNPSIMIYPISKTLCFCMLRSEKEIDITKDEYIIPIEVWNKDADIKQHFIDGYITQVAISFVVDDTNIAFVQSH
ncbi:MAG: DUF4238 domain-containing protein [Clostridiales bacterium]|nr:DUF4238 domain-containing protein [Clostridiales bacterium]